MHGLANPARFLRLSARLTPWLALVAALAIPAGLGLGLFGSPPDYQQGETVRIMYLHVPAAWIAMLGYASMTAASVAAIVWRHPVAALWTKAVAPLGAGFTALCLVTGSLWGQPTWGTWWVWDARLTSVLILFFLYLGYIALVGAFDDEERGLRAGSVLILVGSVNLPVIKFSVDWWNTLHQPASVFRFGGPTIHPDMLWPLLLMAGGLTALFLLLALWATQAEILRRRIETMRLLAAQG